MRLIEAQPGAGGGGAAFVAGEPDGDGATGAGGCVGGPQSQCLGGDRSRWAATAARAPAPPAPFADLPKLLALAARENVTVKISGACTLSHEPFPYGDIWDPLWRIFDAFGLNRCMWGTDWTRAVDVLTYEQGVEAFRVTDRLSDAERATLMGETLRRVYRWAPSKG